MENISLKLGSDYKGANLMRKLAFAEKVAHTEMAKWGFG